ncbi:MAG TPA: hypothetical protein VFH72_04165 [Candidatus Baltobacteraceae bacterium]|nr:hypothetical protein [Candidatus Baltobacteraceae bacterium]
MKQYVAVLCASSALVLAACGGGGGGTPSLGGGTPPTVKPTATPTPTPTPTPNTTVAQGTLVDDPSGTALAGVKVQLDPWIAYATPGPTPTPVAVSTTDPQGHFTISASNGTYLLVIGVDAINTPPPGWSTPSPSATDTPIPGASGWRPTIHDRIVLTGGGTAASPIRLVAPTMPPQPLYTPPAVETNGDYRLITIDPLIEAPCILAWNSLRAGKGLAGSVADEWSLENSYAIAWGGFQPNGGGTPFYPLTTGNGNVSGGADCLDMLNYQWNFASVQTYAYNSQTFWFGGAYIPSDPAIHSAYGADDFPIDPRVYADPNNLVWP